MSNWALTPYLYSRISNWYAVNGALSGTVGVVTTSDLRITLNLVDKYWLGGDIVWMGLDSTPSLNDINTPGRSS